MEAKAHLKYVRISPRKVKIVLDDTIMSYITL